MIHVVHAIWEGHAVAREICKSSGTVVLHQHTDSSTLTHIHTHTHTHTQTRTHSHLLARSLARPLVLARARARLPSHTVTHDNLHSPFRTHTGNSKGAFRTYTGNSTGAYSENAKVSQWHSDDALLKWHVICVTWGIDPVSSELLHAVLVAD